jgi:hypothetical protein
MENGQKSEKLQSLQLSYGKIFQLVKLADAFAIWIVSIILMVISFVMIIAQKVE